MSCLIFLADVVEVPSRNHPVIAMFGTRSLGQPLSLHCHPSHWSLVRICTTHIDLAVAGHNRLNIDAYIGFLRG